MKEHKHEVQMYTASAIEDHAEVSLTQDDLILIAVLRGGDYSSVGSLIGQLPGEV